LTQENVSRHFEWHAAKVTRIKTARVAVTARDVRDLLDLSRPGRRVSRRAGRHLLEMAQLPNVNLQILPFGSGEHGFLGGPVALLEFQGVDAQMNHGISRPQTTHLDVVYLEGLAGDSYEEQPAEVARYRSEFERLSAKALDHRQTIKMIESLLVA
jgi:hypothetical protein